MNDDGGTVACRGCGAELDDLAAATTTAEGLLCGACSDARLRSFRANHGRWWDHVEPTGRGTYLHSLRWEEDGR